MGIVKTRKLCVRPKIILFSKTVQDNGNRSGDICLVMPAVGQAGHSLSMRQLRSLWLEDCCIVSDSECLLYWSQHLLRGLVSSAADRVEEAKN